MAAKTQKKSISLTDNDIQNFLKGEENQVNKRKTESYAFSGFGNGISCGWERQSTTGRFATGRFCVSERFLLSVRTKSITENFVHEKLRPLFVFIVINAGFHLACANAFLVSIRRLSILSFSFINKVLSHSYDCAHAWAIKLNTRR